ncbi:MAG: hypothetical protein CL609_12260 [Anaerolineaceae bacterium]|nr:hypothetical protein [Anaerolineaceae bacterium]
MKIAFIFLGFFVCLASCNPSVNNLSITPRELPLQPTKLIPTTNNLLQTEDFFEVTSKTITSTPQPEITNNPTSYPLSPIKKTINYTSPLQDIATADLPFIISNPFLQPQIGKDDAHHGVDFAFYQYKDFGTIANLPIHSIFSGKITGITENLPPYGNMLIIETDLPDIIMETVQKEPSMMPSDNWMISPQLTCPELPLPPSNLSDKIFSLYVLYAHLAEPPLFQMSNEVQSGDLIGNVGNSGMSGNPHLHLEFRVGPSNYYFEPMGHYSSALTDKEMENYCIWRVSGWFIPIDPMLFFNSLNSTAN